MLSKFEKNQNIKIMKRIENRNRIENKNVEQKTNRMENKHILRKVFLNSSNFLSSYNNDYLMKKKEEEKPFKRN